MAVVAPLGVIDFGRAGELGADNVERLAYFPDGRLYKVTSVILFATGQVRIEGISLDDARRISARRRNVGGLGLGAFRKPSRAAISVAVDEVIPSIVAPLEYVLDAII